MDLHKTYTKLLRALLYILPVLAIALAPFSQSLALAEGVNCAAQWPYSLPLGTPSEDILIEREDYCVSFNPSTKFADWVAYHLTPDQVTGVAIRDYTIKNESAVTPDQALELTDLQGIYTTLKMDRGHLAPLTLFRSIEDKRSISYLGNIVPQASGLNRGVWRILEKQVRQAALDNPEVYVMTGTAYTQEMPDLPNADEAHVIPSGFWKIIKIADQVDAYYFPQNTPLGATVDQGKVSIIDLENLTGFQFNIDSRAPSME